MTEGELFELELELKGVMDKFIEGCLEHGWDISDRLKDIVFDLNIGDMSGD